MTVNATEKVPIVRVKESEVEISQVGGMNFMRQPVTVPIPAGGDCIFEFVVDDENVKCAIASPSPIAADRTIDMDKWLTLVGCNVGKITENGVTKGLIRARARNMYNQDLDWAITVLFQ